MPYRFAHLLAAIMLLSLVAVPGAAQSGRVRKPVEPTGAAHPEPATAPVAPEAPADPPRKAPVPVDAKFDVQYAGGSLGFERDEKVQIHIKDGSLSFSGKKAQFSVYADRVTEMSYGQSVRNRTAEAVGVSVIVPSVGGLINKSKSTAHYIEVLWAGSPSGGIAFRVDKDDYRGLIAALEGVTGLEVKLDPAPPYRDVQP